jgi:hypothetical protein
MPNRDALRRRRPYRNPHPRFLIVCEGTLTERGYFTAFRHAERSLINLEISPGGVPRTLVQRAIELRSEADQKAKNSKDENERFEHVWCVFDIDEHPGVLEAKQQARDNRIDVAISNPCFELWMLLHFQDQRAHIERHLLRQECGKFLPGYDKEVPFAKLHPRYGEALKRASDLDVWQTKRGLEGSNPWTGVYRLTEKIKRFRQSGP